MIKKVCVILIDRANYGRLHPVMRAIKEDEHLELVTICAATMLLERFGQVETIVQKDGFDIDGRVYLEVEGSIPITMAKSIGLGIIGFSSELSRLSPDIVLLIGDRYEALAAAISAAYLNIPLAHIQGGELSGSIDESARHAITKFSQLHFPSTKRASDYIKRMGEREDCVFNVGCPAGDYILKIKEDLPADLLSKIGVGGSVNLEDPFLLVIFHPVTTEFGSARSQTDELLSALHELKMPTVWIWPNIDAGSGDIAKSIRVYRGRFESEWLHLVKNLDPISFQKLLKLSACAVGNSSSFIRDSTFSGTPVVLLGSRQEGREHGDNLISIPVEKAKILDTIQYQLSHGRYPVSELYGNGTASSQIVTRLKEFKPFTQKLLQY